MIIASYSAVSFAISPAHFYIPGCNPPNRMKKMVLRLSRLALSRFSLLVFFSSLLAHSRRLLEMIQLKKSSNSIKAYIPQDTAISHKLFSVVSAEPHSITARPSPGSVGAGPQPLCPLRRKAPTLNPRPRNDKSAAEAGGSGRGQSGLEW
jgi:hypothetical protein